MKFNSKSRTRRIIAATWILPTIFATPYVYCRRYPFVIESDLGQISRQICNDRFDEIDMMIYGSASGRFRQMYFLFICFTFYIIPMVAIIITCTGIAISISSPVNISDETSHRTTCWQRQAESKRKVSSKLFLKLCQTDN